MDLDDSLDSSPQYPPRRPVAPPSSSSSVNPSDVTLPGGKHEVLSFFDKRERQNASKESSFKKVLDSRVLKSDEQNSSKSMSKVSRFSKSNWKKSGEEREARLRVVIEENQKALSKLQSQMKREEQLNDFEKNLLKEEKNRYLNKIQDLEGEIEQLYRQNYRLKEMEKGSARPAESFHAHDFTESSGLVPPRQPYVIVTRKNNLDRINRKHQHPQTQPIASLPPPPGSPDRLGSKLQKEIPVTPERFFGRQERNHSSMLGDLLQDGEPQQRVAFNQSRTSHNNSRNHPHNSSHNNSQGSWIRQGNNFDTFHMANTLSFINESAIGESRQMARMSSATATRNKVAFFKPSLVLIRDSQVEIAYKRSELNQSLDRVRLIFYVNNKTGQTVPVSFNYQPQSEYFRVHVAQKLTQVRANSQGREVVEVTLVSSVDLNGVTDMKVEVGSNGYDLWLPVCFITFRQVQHHNVTGETLEMTVLPDRQFSSFESLATVVPALFGGKDGFESWGYIFGVSKFGNHAVRLAWRPREVTIECTDKWIDFLGFVFHFFK